MFYLLLMLGLISTATGVFVLGFGIPIRETAFGSSLLISGTVAITGGFVTLGLAAAVAELRSVLQALKARIPAVGRPTRPAERKEVDKRLAIPQSLRPAPDPVAGEAAPTSASREPPASPQSAASRVTARKPEWLRRAFAELSSDSRPPAPSVASPDLHRNESRAEKNEVRPERTWPRRAPSPPAEFSPPVTDPIATEPRQPALPAPAQPDAFDMVWPSARTRPADERTTDKLSPPPPRARQPDPRPVPTVTPTDAVAPPSQPERPDARTPPILKSGVIDEMAYTLFTDGSIEAQMPEGTVRFASIEELRDHLEKQAD